MELRVAFISGLSDKKLAQKLAPLQSLPEIKWVDLYRRQPFSGDKIRWMPMPRLCSRFAPFGDLWRFFGLIKNASRYDVIIACHQRFHGAYAALAGILRGVPVVQLTITDPQWIENTFLGWTLRWATAVGFRGMTTLEAFRKRFGDNKLLFVPHNVWRPGSGQGSVQRTIDLLFVGYLAGYKNIPAWLDIAAQIKRRRGQLRAVWVGDKPGRHISSRIRNLGLDENLEFTGPLEGDALRTKYAQTRVFLLTSLWEGLPMVALEAMCSGVPVVATDVGDTRDLIEDGVNGYLVEVGDIRGAVRAVDGLLTDERLWERMSAKARRSAWEFVTLNTLDRAVEQWRHVLSRMELV